MSGMNGHHNDREVWAKPAIIIIVVALARMISRNCAVHKPILHPTLSHKTEPCDTTTTAPPPFLLLLCVGVLSPYAVRHIAIIAQKVSLPWCDSSIRLHARFASRIAPSNMIYDCALHIETPYNIHIVFAIIVKQLGLATKCAQP